VSTEVIGYVDRRFDERRVDPDGLLQIPESELLRTLLEDGTIPDGATGLVHGIGRNESRIAVHGSCAPGCFRIVVHPRAVVAQTVEMGEGTVVLAQATVNPGTVVGQAVILNTGCIVEHDCVIADGVHVSPGAILAGDVRVGTGAWVGAGATVIQNIVIGSEAIVGAGATVIEDVQPGSTVVGVPARPIHRA
jgi:sugar O-acyltransferase (sialic acid O-acetyltransferase NeuD family)